MIETVKMVAGIDHGMLLCFSVHPPRICGGGECGQRH